MEGRGLVPRLLGIDHLPTKSRSHPCARWLVLTCRGWGPPAESCCSHHPFEKHVGPSAPTPQSRPRAEFEKLVLAPAMFPLPASAPQGLGLFWSLLRSQGHFPPGHRDPWGTGHVPHSAWFPTALPARGLPRPVWRWLQGRWPDTQISTLSLFTPPSLLQGSRCQRGS